MSQGCNQRPAVFAKGDTRLLTSCSISSDTAELSSPRNFSTSEGLLVEIGPVKVVVVVVMILQFTSGAERDGLDTGDEDWPSDDTNTCILAYFTISHNRLILLRQWDTWCRCEITIHLRGTRRKSLRGTAPMSPK